MKTKLLICLLKAILTGIVENYNPYANAALVMACLQQNLSELSSMLKLACQQLQQLMHHPALG